MNDQDEPFLKRWSRRKAEAKEPSPGSEADAAEAAPDGVRRDGAEVAGDKAGKPDGLEAEETRPLTEADFADVDFEALNMESDYGRFLRPNVPEAIKRRALRQLWTTNSIFTQVDPFQDYAEDYTDAARAVVPGTLKTSYRIGRGFLSDEEVAEWENLGKPEVEKEQAVASATETAEDAEPKAAVEEAPAGSEAEQREASEGVPESAPAAPTAQVAEATEDAPDAAASDAEARKA